MFDKLDLNNKNRFDLIVDYRNVLMPAILVITVVFAAYSPMLQLDPTLRSGLDTTSEAYKQYQKFVADFGDEEFLLVVLSNSGGLDSPMALKGLETVTRRIEDTERITEVISLSTMRLFQKKGNTFGNHPVLRADNKDLNLPEPLILTEMKTALPIMELLLSEDHKTLGALVKIEDDLKFDTKGIEALVSKLREIAKENMPVGTECRIIGSAIIRLAIVNYNIQTGIVFGILCLAIGTIVSIYVFKSLKITLITNCILIICIIWVLGLMSVLGIPLNSTTALSFGFIPITTVEIVIHVVVRYHLFFREARDKISAIKKAVRWLVRPVFICSATTAVGFGTLMVSDIPMVNQLGFIMAFGIILSTGLAMILVPAFFIRIKLTATDGDSPVLRDWMDSVLDRTSYAIFKHHTLFVGIGALITVLLFAGSPFIKSDAQILRMLSDSTNEVKNLDYVEKNLAPVHAIEVVLEGRPNTFKQAANWVSVEKLDSELRKLPEVASVDSFLPLLTYMNQVCSVGDAKDITGDPALIPQLMAVITLSADGERIVRRHLNPDFSRLHIALRIKNSPDVPIGTTIKEIRNVASRVIPADLKPVVTGELTVVADQADALISDQMKSMFLAAGLIAILMIIQMQSVVLGLISLIPNIPPVAAVFGIMGWFGVSLDSVTVFAATVAIGLAVDNTIHYLTQLKREISTNPDVDIHTYVKKAYRLTARQILSWSTITLLGFLALSVSPFRPVVFFGVLGSSAILLGIFGDLIFLQSLILSSSIIRRTIVNLVKKENPDLETNLDEELTLGAGK